MDTQQAQARPQGHHRQRRIEVLAAIAPQVEEAIEAHLDARRLWMPDELLDEGLRARDGERLGALRRAAAELPAEVCVSVALNLLTEEGLPHFHRLIATHLPEDSPWQRWNHLWTAEEDRHGCALRDWARDAGVFDMRALEQLQYRYIEAGFTPDWRRDPYRLLAYTSLQERATQMAHANTGRRAAGIEPQLQRVLAHLAGDEGRHYRFYRTVFGALLDADPSEAVGALLAVMPVLDMPGHSIAGYGDMAETVGRCDIYGPRHYRAVVVELLEYWRIGERTGLSGEAARAQERLMALPARLQRMEELLARRRRTRTLRFDFLPGRPITLRADRA